MMTLSVLSTSAMESGPEMGTWRGGLLVYRGLNNVCLFQYPLAPAEMASSAQMPAVRTQDRGRKEDEEKARKSPYNPHGWSLPKHLADTYAQR